MWIALEDNFVDNSSAGACLPLSLANGKVTYSNRRHYKTGRYVEGTEATFSCNSGYYFFGSQPARCQNSLNWDKHDKEEFTCVKGDYEAFPIQFVSYFCFYNPFILLPELICCCL